MLLLKLQLHVWFQYRLFLTFQNPIKTLLQKILEKRVLETKYLQKKKKKRTFLTKYPTLNGIRKSKKSGSSSKKLERKNLQVHPEIYLTKPVRNKHGLNTFGKTGVTRFPSGPPKVFETGLQNIPVYPVAWEN